MSPREEAVRILIVDDDKEMRDFLTQQLDLRGFKTEAVSSGGEAIEHVRTRHFDLMICDLRMPLIDGIACLESVSNLAPEMHVIMMSGEATVENAVNAMKKGACDFLQKPVRMENLLFRIDKILLKNRMDSITRLYEKSLLLLSHLTPEEMLKPMLSTVSDFFHADESCWISVKDGLLEIVASRGLNSQAACAMLARGEQAMKDPGGRSFLDKGLAVIPLWSENQLQALLLLSRAPGKEELSLSELREAAEFGSQMLKTLENSRTRVELDDKVGRLKEAYEELERSKSLLVQREKLSKLGALVASVAHEMNGPLTIMIGYSDLLLRSSKTEDKEKRPISIIRSEAERCYALVCGLLDFARERKPRFQWMRLHELVQETVEALALELKEQRVAVRVSELPKMPGIYADPDQLRQVLLNLLKNAVQAMASQAEKRIDIAAACDKNAVRLTVRDNGPGIAPENIDRIFDPYFTTKGSGGTGIGLSICSDIVRAHHGKLSVQSAAGHGASFCLELPQNQPEAHTPVPHAA